MSSASASLSNSNPPVRAYGPRSAITLAALCVLSGLAFLFLHRQLNEQSELTDATWTKTSELHDDLASLEQQTTSLADELPRAQQQFETRVAELEEIHGSMNEKLREIRAEAASQQLYRDALRARVAEVRSLRAEVRADLDALEQDVRDWTEQSQQLLHNDLGRRLAARPELLRQYRLLDDSPPVTEKQIERWDEQLAVRFESLGERSDDADMMLSVPKESIGALEDIHRGIRDVRSAVRAKQSELQHLMQQAARVSTPAERDLQSALEHFEQQEVQGRLERIAEAEKRAFDEYTEKLAAERAATARERGELQLKKERELRDLELAAVEANSNIEAQKLKDAIAEVKRQEAQRQAELKAKIERKTLEAEFQAAMPEIRSYLIPLIAHSRWQLTGQQWKYVDTAGPVSLSAIRARGALQNTESGYEAVYWICGGPQNERPNGPFDRYIGGAIHPRRIPLARKVQTLLNEFGELMVEKGMLAP